MKKLVLVLLMLMALPIAARGFSHAHFQRVVYVPVVYQPVVLVPYRPMYVATPMRKSSIKFFNRKFSRIDHGHAALVFRTTFGF